MRNSVRVTKLTTHSVMSGNPAGPPPRPLNLFTMSNIAPRHLWLEANGGRRIRYFLDDHIRNASTREPNAPDTGPRRARLVDLAPRLGGAERDRTDDLLLAKQALSQLSYSPRDRRSDSENSDTRFQDSRRPSPGGPGKT